ncbi:MAG: gp109 [uncultured marine phage]|uniref:Gp109 n=1 Tax=uncultured marine phage TaxID=707152 RepID=A0A8D9FRJ3_9VIRU|nr:MAG: gp109 [uncultured marine phage]
MDYNEVLNRANLKDSDVICAYQYGSRVYGNITKHSDWDFIFVMKEKPNEQFSDTLININFFDVEQHKTRILNHEISALETLFLDDEYILKEDIKFDFTLNLKMLRRSLSRKSSNSWVKAKKKLTVEKDYDLDVGRKSMWHSFRIADFGIQLATKGMIYNYSSKNDLYYEVIYNYSDWSELFENYKKSYNSLMTEFRKVAPK